MFKVKHYKTGEEFMVYGVKQSEDLTTWFLTFQTAWFWMDAEFYLPV